MGANPRAMLVLCANDDPLGRAVIHLLAVANVPVRTPALETPADELAASAFGCRAIIAVGDRFAADPAVLGAANMPGVRALVVVVRGEVNLKPLRTRGVPYTVIRVAPVLEEIVAALRPHVEAGRLIIDPREDRLVATIAALDAARCAIAAVDHDDVCGRVVHVAAPERLTLADVARRAARAAGQELKVVEWPRWALAALRAIGRRSFQLPPDLRVSDFPVEDVAMLHPGAWRSVEETAVENCFFHDDVTAMRRTDDHAMGM